jgi:cellulose synthase/poly-beta-1,6-N-acetylglucosamine synthase-like glycosyltransferase
LLIGLGAARRRSGAGVVRRPPIAYPTVSVVIPAFNEAAVIAAKIENTKALTYPSPLEIIVVADGSDDSTEAVAREAGTRTLYEPERRGKSAALNRGVAVASGEVVVLTDANCMLAPRSVLALVAEMADPSVAVVSGSKTVTGEGAHGAGEGMYWRFEARLKDAEAAFGATMGAPGEVIAIRRSAFAPIPEDVINDDFHLTCEALRHGWRVTYAGDAQATEDVSARVADELERRTRIAAGTWQTTLGHLDLADPRRGWVALAFISHRVLRSVVTPLLLAPLWVYSLVSARRSRLARSAAVVQTAVYGAAILGSAMDAPVLSAPFEFGLANLATIRGAWRYLTGRQPVTWARAPRPQPASGGRP